MATKSRTFSELKSDSTESSFLELGSNKQVYSAKPIRGDILIRGSKQPVNTVVLSALAITMIVIVLPLMAGGTISLAIALGGEDNYATAPDNANGYLVVNSSQSTSTPCTSWSTSSSVIVTNQFDKNWTRINNPAGCNNEGIDYINIIIPFYGLFPDPLNHTFTQFNYSIASYSSYLTGSCCGNSSAMKYVTYDLEILINGTSVISSSEKSPEYLNYEVSGQERSRYYIGGEIQLDGTDYVNYRSEVDNCYPNCTALLNISNWQPETTYSGGSQYPPFGVDFMVNFETLTTDVETGNALVVLMPYLMSIFVYLVALASTPWWNPVSKSFIGRFARF